MKNTRFILAIDGGGVRGILPLTMLSYLDKLLCEENDKASTINQRFDFFAGTSTGAIISAALMLEDKGVPVYSPNAILELYKHRGAQIFDPKRPENQNEPALKLLLEHNFGHLKMSELPKRYAFVSYDEATQNPFVFQSGQSNFRDLSLAKVLYACSAVAEYFPPVQLQCYSLSDGIKTAKNPAIIAYRYARSYFPDDNIVLLSLGTGVLPENVWDEIEEDVLDVHKSLMAKSRNNKFFKYYRIQPNLIKANYRMDDSSPENILHLISDGEEFIRQNTSLFQEILKDFKHLQ